MRAALDFSINDRNLFEMKIFLTISIQIKKGTLPVSLSWWKQYLVAFSG
jgi:hypothetical protein